MKDFRLSQAVAAKKGDVERLKQLWSEAGQWSEETAEAAFEAGQLETFYWLRSHDPPCPWSFPVQEWASDMLTSSRLSNLSHKTFFPDIPILSMDMHLELPKPDLRHKRLRLLSETIIHASACAERKSAQLFFDALLVQMFDAMECHGCCWMPLSWAMDTTAAAGLVKTTKWLLEYSKRNGKSIQETQRAFAAAAKAGQLSIMTLLLEAHELSTWGQRGGIEACNNNQRVVLDWLRANGYPWALDCTRQRAVSGDIELLTWMRTQPDPWPWDSSVCTAAKDQPAALRWLLGQSPGCPWAPEEAARCPEAVTALGDVHLIERLHLPVHDLPQLRMPAAQQGNLQLLKWLQRQQPPCQMEAEVCEAALKGGHSDIVHHLAAELEPPVFPRSKISTHLGCMLVLAQVACPMKHRHIPQLMQFMDSWYTFMGLQQWAANQMTVVHEPPEDGNGGHCSDDRTAAPACISSQHSSSNSQAIAHPEAIAPATKCKMEVLDGLLAQLAQLPHELATKIASDAFLSPQQASKIPIAVPPPDSEYGYEGYASSSSPSCCDGGYSGGGWEYGGCSDGSYGSM